MTTIKGYKYLRSTEPYEVCVKTDTNCLTRLDDDELSSALATAAADIEYYISAACRSVAENEPGTIYNLEYELYVIEASVAGLLGVVATIRHHKGL